MAKDKRWMQKAAKRMKKKGTVGSFTRWAKSHGYGGVNSEAIAAGLRAGGKIAKKAAFAKAARKARHVQGGQIGVDEYSFGGIMSGLGSGAGMGASIGSLFPGAGTLIGGAIGGIAGLIGGIAGHNKEKKQAAYDDRQEDIANIWQTQADEVQQGEKEDLYYAGMGGSENPYTPTFPMGGTLGYAQAEVEDDEVLQRPGGKLKKMSGKRHSQGGIDVEEPIGTRVYSDREVYKKTGKTFAEEAEVIRKRIAQLDKQLT